MTQYGYDTYLSVFTHRYGTKEMRSLFSERTTRKLWRKVWVALAEVQAHYGLLSEEEVDDIRSHADDIDIQRAHEIEQELHHDVMAEIKTYAEQCPIGGGKLHYGATSMDIRDNAEVLQLKQALLLVRQQIQSVLSIWKNLITRYNDVVAMGYTHLQVAEPITLGYRFANYAQDFLIDYQELERILSQLRSKGMKGAVGTGASYCEILRTKGIDNDEFETLVLNKLGLVAFDVSTQVYPRKQDFLIMNVLASIAQSASKVAFDIRILQSSLFDELAEPFGKKQVGSSAMPFKRNPIRSERICSLARLMPNFSQTLWHNAANNILERTLDDSANRRICFAEGFLTISEILKLLQGILIDIDIHESTITRNFARFSLFSGMEPLLMKLVSKGEDRQSCHEIIRDCCLKAWHDLQEGKENTLLEHVANNPTIMKYFTKDQIEEITYARHHIGNAREKSLLIVEKIRKILGRDEENMGKS